MAIAKDVIVNINLAKAGTRSGFGFPLIFEGKATSEIAYKECSNLDEVAKVAGNTSNIYKAAQLLLMQNDKPAKIAVCASASTAVLGLPKIIHHGWRQLIVTSLETTGESTRKQISDYIETTPDKMYFTSVAATTDLSGATAITGNDRTFILCHADENSVKFPEAALVGATAGKSAGSFTYKNIILKGLTPKVMSQSEIDAVHAVHAAAFVLKCGDGVTSEGMVTSSEYADIIDSQDYIVQGIEYNVQKLLNSSDKVPYDNAGIGRLENTVTNVLKEAYNNGIIATGDDGLPAYSVSFKPRKETSAANRTARKYVDGSFHFALAGAIHEVEINGIIEI